MKVVGIDLAGKQENDTGFCLLDGSDVVTRVLKSDVEIVEVVRGTEPDVVAVDAPFSFPDEGMYRDCDKELKDMGYEVLSPNYPGMKVLVQRAKALIGKLKGLGEFDIIEVFPRAAEKNLPVKRTNSMTEDEYDAFLCALTGRKYMKDEYMDLDGIVIPEEE